MKYAQKQRKIEVPPNNNKGFVGLKQYVFGFNSENLIPFKIDRNSAATHPQSLRAIPAIDITFSADALLQPRFEIPLLDFSFMDLHSSRSTNNQCIGTFDAIIRI